MSNIVNIQCQKCSLRQGLNSSGCEFIKDNKLCPKAQKFENITEELINKIDEYIGDWALVALSIGYNLQWKNDEDKHKEDLSTQAAKDYKQALIKNGKSQGQREIYMPKYVLERLEAETQLNSKQI